MFSVLNVNCVNIYGLFSTLTPGTRYSRAKEDLFVTVVIRKLRFARAKQEHFAKLVPKESISLSLCQRLTFRYAPAKMEHFSSLVPKADISLHSSQKGAFRFACAKAKKSLPLVNGYTITVFAALVAACLNTREKLSTSLLIQDIMSHRRRVFYLILIS